MDDIENIKVCVTGTYNKETKEITGGEEVEITVGNGKVHNSVEDALKELNPEGAEAAADAAGDSTTATDPASATPGPASATPAPAAAGDAAAEGSAVEEKNGGEEKEKKGEEKNKDDGAAAAKVDTAQDPNSASFMGVEGGTRAKRRRPKRTGTKKKKRTKRQKKKGRKTKKH